MALLTTEAERAAHIRAQIVDYASVSEGLLAHCLVHAIRNGHVVGTGYQFRDPDIVARYYAYVPNDDAAAATRAEASALLHDLLLEIEGRGGRRTLLPPDEQLGLLRERLTVING